MCPVGLVRAPGRKAAFCPGALGHVHRAFRRKKASKSGNPKFCPYLTMEADAGTAVARVAQSQAAAAPRAGRQPCATEGTAAARLRETEKKLSMLSGRAALLTRVRPGAAVCRPAGAVGDSSRRRAAAACCSLDARGLASATPTQQVPLHAPRGGNPARVRIDPARLSIPAWVPPLARLRARVLLTARKLLPQKAANFGKQVWIVDARNKVRAGHESGTLQCHRELTLSATLCISAGAWAPLRRDCSRAHR